MHPFLPPVTPPRRATSPPTSSAHPAPLSCSVFFFNFLSWFVTRGPGRRGWGWGWGWGDEGGVPSNNDNVCRVKKELRFVGTFYLDPTFSQGSLITRTTEGSTSYLSQCWVAKIIFCNFKVFPKCKTIFFFMKCTRSVYVTEGPDRLMRKHDSIRFFLLLNKSTA